MNYLSIISLALILGMSACKKEEEHEHEHEETSTTATITLTNPTAGDSIVNATQLTISGTISGSNSLHGYDLEVKNITADSVVYSTSEGLHATSYTLNYQWMNDVLITSNMTLKVKAYHDHDHTSWDEKTVLFVCKQP